MVHRADTRGQKTFLFSPSFNTVKWMADQFTKTGSGQTWGKLKGKLTKKLKTRANAFSP
eukprot:COSAG06_NODE_69270_length_198_cov_23.828283_1_plen_58_part_01